MEMLFKHFDQARKGTVTKDEFLAAFESQVKDVTFQCNIEDIIKPLATKLRKFNKTIGKIFQEYDNNNNGKLSAEEIKHAMKVCV
jgi:Ca2+-binding EF-hand superfamily protein